MSDNNHAEELTEKELEKALAQLFKRSQTDPEFRKRCIATPDEAIFEISGKWPPKGKPISFVEKEDAP